MVKATTSAFAMTLLAGSALAVPVHYQIQASDIQTRSPRFGRNHNFSKGALHAGEHAADFSDQNQRRSVDLEERSPGLIFIISKGLFHAGEHASSMSNQNQNQRRSVDLEERSPGFGGLFKSVFHVGEHAADLSQGQNQRRSVDLEERSPLFGGLVKDVFKVAEHAVSGLSQNNNNNHKRSLDADENIILTREELEQAFGREFADELEERGIGSFFSGLKKFVGLRRSLDTDDAELLERSYYDDLD